MRVVWSYHLKPKDLAALAKKARVKQLVLINESNYSNPYNPEALLNEIKQCHSGNVIQAMLSRREMAIFSRHLLK